MRQAGVFSKLLGLIWPDPKSAETLIKESEAKMKAWVKLEIEERLANMTPRSYETCWTVFALT
jgi:hypothetical protein